MKNNFSKRSFTGGLMLACAGLAGASTFTYTSHDYSPSMTSIPTQTSGGISVSENGVWANVNNSGATDTGTSNFFALTDIAEYSGAGLGVCNPNEQAKACAAPQHQIDNYNGLDFVNFSFSNTVSLGDVDVKSFGNPTGAGFSDIDLSYSILTQAQESALQNGTLVFSSVNFTTISTNFNGSNDYTLTGTGRYLLIGAAVTPHYGDSSASQATPDAFKIQTLAVSGVPEPASLLLIGSGLLAVGVFGSRRNRKTRS